MTDIAMCVDDECPSHLQCRRYTAPRDPFNQLYATFNRPDSHPCVEFWDDEGYPRGDHTPSEDE